jgi:Tol biopolymer transport system component
MTRALVALICGSLFLASQRAVAADTDRLDLFILEIESGKVTPFASTPLPGHTYCGSPDWSPDGRHVLLDATPGRQFSRSHILAADFPVLLPSKFLDLGPGNCPTWSPDGKQIVFRLIAGAAGEQPGIWTMNVDGTGRKRLTGGSRPDWSPDGKWILSATFSNPCQLTLFDAMGGAEQNVVLAGHEFLSVPSWAGDGQTLVSVVRVATTLSIALVDVSDPAAKIKQVLWTRGKGVRDEPIYPVYSVRTKQCVFVGRSTNGHALYQVGEQPDALPTRLEPTFYDKRIAGLAMSPDGRYVLFGSERQPDALDP